MRNIFQITLLVCGVLVSQYGAHGGWLMDMMKAEPDARSQRELETRELLDELDRLTAVEKELARRSKAQDEYDDQLTRIGAAERKRQVIRHTPEPPVRRLKVTPPPNVPEPIHRFDKTPMPPSEIEYRPAWPQDVVDGPRRQTPRPLRLTPEPPVRPAVYPDEGRYAQELDEEQEMWNQMNRRERLARDEQAEQQRRYYFSDERGWEKK